MTEYQWVMTEYQLKMLALIHQQVAIIEAMKADNAESVVRDETPMHKGVEFQCVADELGRLANQLSG